MRRFLAMLLLTGSGFVLMGAPAMAASYPPADPTAGVSDTSPKPGAAVTVTGDHWCPGSTVTLTLQPGSISLGTAKVASDGSFATQVTIPSDLAAGTYSIVVSGLKDDCTTTGSVRIAIQVAAAGGTVAFTGARVSQGLVLLIALLVVGALALFVGRRRALRAR